MSLTEFLLPFREIEPLFATHLEDVAQERETLWPGGQLPPWTLEVAYNLKDNQASRDAGHQGGVLLCDGDDCRRRQNTKADRHEYRQVGVLRGVMVFKYETVPWACIDWGRGYCSVHAGFAMMLKAKALLLCPEVLSPRYGMVNPSRTDPRGSTDLGRICLT